MFESLKAGISKAISGIRDYGKITESNISTTVKDIRKILIQSDVNYNLAKEITEKIKKEAIDTKLIASLNPQQLFCKIVYDNIIDIMSCGDHNIKFATNGKKTLILLVGLQGAGKTTFSAKLANFISIENKKKLLLVACDIYRPAAIEQLEVLATQNKIDFYKEPNEKNVNNIIKNAIKKADENNNDVLIIDTAGRQSVDKNMMDELKNIINSFEINESLLVIDGMIGQISVNVAKEFNNAINLTGIILSKMDGDSNGGVALSVTAHINKPIKFISVGEKINQLECFYPDRIANRILGKGDIATLLEKADRVLNEEEDDIFFSKNNFSFNEMMFFLTKIEKLGGVNNIICFLPDSVKVNNNMVKECEYFVNNVKIIYNSMTPKERKCYSKLNLSRKIRIAKGSGKKVDDVDKIIKFHEKIKQMMKLVNNKNYNDLFNIKNNK